MRAWKGNNWNMKIRKATFKDVDKLVRIEMNSGYKWGMKKEKFASHLKRILNLKYSRCFILESKRAIGYFLVNIERKSCYLNYFAIIKSRHGKGYSKIMIGKAISFAEKQNCKKIELGVWAKNFPAIGLYNKYGFYIFEIKRKHYSNRDDKLRMRKELK